MFYQLEPSALPLWHFQGVTPMARSITTNMSTTVIYGQKSWSKKYVRLLEHLQRFRCRQIQYDIYGISKDILNLRKNRKKEVFLIDKVSGFWLDWTIKSYVGVCLSLLIYCFLDPKFTISVNFTSHFYCLPIFKSIKETEA